MPSCKKEEEEVFKGFCGMFLHGLGEKGIPP
jgi:hypothetical protein